MTHKLLSENLHNSIPEDRDIFGKFLGKWKLKLTIFSFDGSSKNHTGEWHFFRILQGRAIQDIWIIPDLNDDDNYHEFGTTVRMFDLKRNIWKASWIGPIQNQLFVFDIEDNNNIIILKETHNQKLNMKWSFFDISKKSFKWKSEVKMSDNNYFTNYYMELSRINENT